jgi:DNA-binding LytR/AlgR family response regulator
VASTVVIQSTPKRYMLDRVQYLNGKVMRIKVTIVNADLYTCETLSNYIQQTPHLELLNIFTDAESALSFLKSSKVDLVLLDIELPGINGLEFLRMLSSQTKIIILSTSRRYAFECFELNVVDYLLKPFSYKRFISAVNRLYEYSLFSRSSNEVVVDYLCFKSSGKLTKVYLNTILFIQGLSNYVKVVLHNDVLVTYQKLSYLEEKLSKNQFVRVHRSYIVALQYIQAVNSKGLKIMNHHIPIGQKYKKNLVMINDYLMLK